MATGSSFTLTSLTTLTTPNGFRAPINAIQIVGGVSLAPGPGDVNGLRLGTPEIARFGMTPADMPELAGYIAEGLNGSRSAEAVARDVTAFRGRFRELHFMR